MGNNGWKRCAWILALVCLLLIAGCKDSDVSDYEDNDVAALVRGEEITVGELRFLFPDDQILENIDGFIKGKLAIQEVKKMNLDVSEEIHEMEEMKDVILMYPDEKNNAELANDIRKFADPQAEKLGMEPAQYYDEYYDKTQEMSVYIVAYINDILGEPENNSEYQESANQLLDNLVEENKDDIQILIK